MSTFLSKFISQRNSSQPSQDSTSRPRMPRVIPTQYTSQPVSIPSDFLAPIPDPSTISVSRIDFSKTSLPEYDGLYAIVLDNVLSREECSQFLHLTEQSAGAHQATSSPAVAEGDEVQDNGWKPAMLNAGLGQEYMQTEYRNSDRIIWDEHTMVKRLWGRVLQGEGVKEGLYVLSKESNPGVLGALKVKRGERWVVTERGLNERMRVLRYGAGQFFKKHCDGAYETVDGERSFSTLHLYLNDSVQALRELSAAGKVGEKSSDVTCEGGATTFHSVDNTRKLDVDPLAGRVLIFQHRRLLHSGAEVTKGFKFTMRTDVMYAFEAEEDDGGVVFSNA